MIKIAVLVKQVPDPELVSISEDGRLMRDGVPSMMDPFGLMALQTAIFLKGEDTTITAVSMGPVQAKSVLRKCLEYGADDAVLISDKEYAGSDTLATSRILSAYLSQQNFDLILCGMQATDGDTAQVPAQISVMLDLPFYAYVTSVSSDMSKVTQMYDNIELVTKLNLPAVLSISRLPENHIQLPSMKSVIEASKIDVSIIGQNELKLPCCFIGVKGSGTKVISIEAPERKVIDTEYVNVADASVAVNILKELVK